MTPRLADDLDDYVAAFEAAREAGLAPPLTDFLPPETHRLYLPVLRELVRVDLEYGWRGGVPRPLAGYLDAFPRLAADPAGLRDAAFEEYRLRLLAGQRPSPAEYASRFGIDTSSWFVPTPSTRPEAAARTRLVGSAPQRATGPGADFSVGEGVQIGPAEFPAPGQSFAGFVLTGELGRGSFGRVFLAEQEQLAGRPVALKLSRGTFVREARTLARLQHAHIVPIFSVHRAGGLEAICMPYLGGVTLGELLRRLRAEPGLPATGGWVAEQLGDPGGPAPFREVLGRSSHVEAVLWIGARLAEGLAHAHDRGIVHRDLKPANVLLASDGTPMLLDFNLADDIGPGRAVEDAGAGGTLRYMAPEYIDGLREGTARTDLRVDLYALGLVLYELLAGRYPFPDHPGPVSAALPAMIADRRWPPERLTRYNPAATPAVDAIVRRCLEPDPSRRYQTAHQLREDLQRQLEHRPLRFAPEPSLAERGRKWARRHPRLASSGAVTAVSLVALLVLAGAYWQRMRWQATRMAKSDSVELQRAAREAPLLLASPDGEPDQWREGARRCEEAAGLYGVVTDPGWRQNSSFRHLGADERRRVERSLVELLWLWARAEQWAGRYPEAWRIHRAARLCCPEGEMPGALRRQAERLAPLAGEKDEGAVTGSPFPPERERFLDLFELTDHGRWRQALPRLEALTKNEADNPTVWLLLARVHVEIGDAKTAQLFSEIATSQAPDWPWAWFHQGAYALAAGQWRVAAEASARAAALKPDLAAARLNRAAALLHLREPGEAIAELDRAIGMDTAPTRALFQRALAKRQTGDLEGSRSDFQEGLRRQPADEVSFVARGVARLQADPAGALADFDEALRLNPNSLRALQNRAHVLSEHLRRPEDAVASLDRLLALRGGDLIALSGRAVLLARLGRRGAAVRDAREVLNAQPPPELLYPVACVYALTARQHPPDRAEAFRYLREVMKRDGERWRPVAPRDPDLAFLREDPEFERLVRPPEEGGPSK